MRLLGLGQSKGILPFNTATAINIFAFYNQRADTLWTKFPTDLKYVYITFDQEDWIFNPAIQFTFPASNKQKGLVKDHIMSGPFA